MEFKEIKAEDFCDSVRDGTHASPKKTDSGKKLITSKHIKENGLDLESAYYISEKDYQEINNRSLVEKNDILYSMIGTIGLMHRVKDNPNYAIKNMGLFKLRDELKSKWLYYYLKTPFMKNYINSLLSGSTQQYITLNNLRNVIIKVPEKLEDSQRIIKILDTIEEKVKENNLINNNLHELIKTIYKNEFSNINNPVQAQNIADITIGKTPPRNIHECFTTDNNDIKWISISDLGKCGMYLYNTNERLIKEAVDKYNVKIVPKDTIVLSFKLTIGRIAITSDEMATNEAIAHFNLKDKSLKYYIYCYLKDYDYGKLGSTSSIATAVNSKIIKAMPIDLPDDVKIEKFNNKVIPMFEQIKENESENETLIKLRDILLPKLMNGEIDLENIEI